MPGLRFIPNSGSTQVLVAGDVDFTSASGKLNLHNGTASSPIVTESSIASLTNKTIQDSLTFAQISTPATPASGFDRLYFKSDDNLYKKTSAGVESAVGVTYTIGTYDGNGTVANGLSINGSNQIFAQSADATHPGMVNTATQTFGGIKIFTNPQVNGAIQFNQQATPANPPSGFNKIYFKSDDFVYILNSGGTEVRLSTVGTVGSFDGNGAVANGLSISGGSIFAQSASASFPGMVNTTTQTFAGNKTFNGVLTHGSIDTHVQQVTPSVPATGSDNMYFKSDDSLYIQSHAGVESKVSILTLVGTYDSQSPVANGAVISGNSIYFQSATATVPGMVSTGAQTFAGNKTFGGWVAIQQYVNLTQISTPSIPGAGTNDLYFKTDGNLYIQNSAGVETLVGSSGGGGNVSGPGTSTINAIPTWADTAGGTLNNTDLLYLSDVLHNSDTIVGTGTAATALTFRSADQTVAAGTAAGSSLTIRAGSATGAGSTGNGGDLILSSGSTVGGTAGSLFLGTNSTNRWQVNPSGNLLAVSDGSYDLGAVAGNRPNNLYVKTAIAVGDSSTAGTFTVGATSYKVQQATLNTTDGSAHTLQTIATTSSSSMLIEARIIAHRTGGSAGSANDGAYFILKARVKNNAGTVTVNNLLSEESHDQAWVADLTVSGTNILVSITGATNNNISWHTTTITQVI